jgi:tRNA (guanine-N7-)-methyltransferase
VDVSRRRSVYAAGLAAEAGLENILLLRANFRLLGALTPEHSWRKVYLHFPDPIHKRKDEKRSVFGAGFLDAVASALEPDGLFSVISDNPSLFLPLLEQIEADRRFEKQHPERYLEGSGDLPKSRFQRIWERRGVVPLRVLAKRL